MAHVLFSRISGLSKRSGYVEHCAIKNLREKADVEEGGVLKTLLSIFMCGSCFRKKIIAYKTMSFLSAGLSKVTNNGDNKLDGSANSQTNSQSTFQASQSHSMNISCLSAPPSCARSLDSIFGLAHGCGLFKNGRESNLDEPLVKLA